MKVSKLMIIHGRVQGVGFRYFIQYNAKEIGVKGYVKNLDDGTVEILAQGRPEDVRKLKSIVIKGNGFSKVTRVDEHSSETKTYDDFKIKY
jgi:acylphosphatase